MRIRWWAAAVAVMAFGVALAPVGAGAATSAHGGLDDAASPAVIAPAKMVPVTVEVASPFGGPGDVQVQDLNGNVLATCQGSTNAPSTAACTVGVASGTGILLIAQPSMPGGFKDWTGACSHAPGPVCHLKVQRQNHLQSVGQFGSSPPTPTASPTAPSIFGNTTGCTGFSPPLMVNGTGFHASSAVTLSDDGQQVASGTTDMNGFAQLSYSANSEPGVYRTLVMGAAGMTATTDIYNEGSYCLYQNGTGTGMVSFQVIAADLDANSTAAVKFTHQTPVTGSSDASGAMTVTTPTYACKAGATGNLVIDDIRGAGTKSAYHGSSSFAIVC